MTIDPSTIPILLGVAFFMAAGLYAAVGHGGASAYLAVMGLCGMAADDMKPIALVLNIAVSTLATICFWRQGHFRFSLFLPLAAASIPAAFLGGSMHASDEVFKVLLAVALFMGACRLVVEAPKSEEEMQRGNILGLVVLGCVIGFVSGLVGIGGGIFLTPLLLLLRWAPAKTAAAVSAAFIAVNSCSGLTGFMQSGRDVPHLAWVLLPCVLAGGWLGSYWGSSVARSQTLRRTLACVLLIAAGKFLII